MKIGFNGKIKSLSMFFGVQSVLFLSSKPKVVFYGYSGKHKIDFLTNQSSRWSKSCYKS